MPVTSANFDVANATSSDIARLDKALTYLQQSQEATAMLEMAAQAGVKLGINSWGTDHYGPDVTPGSDQYDYNGSGRVLWNPDSALEVRAADHSIVGVQSAAVGLMHEIFHSLDPGLVDGFMSRLVGYGNISEYGAIQFETLIARQLGEVTRENHWGVSILSLDPTTHTMPTEDGSLVWAQLSPDGKFECGPLYEYHPDGDPSNQVPVFGSSDPGGYYHDGDGSGYGNDGGSPSSDSGNGGQQGDPIGYDDQGNPVYGLPLPGPDTPIVILDPHNGGEGSSDDEDGGGPGGDDWGNGSDNWGSGSESSGSGGSGDVGCVAIESYLPDGRLAGHIKAGDSMELGDDETLAAATGVVSYSQTKQALGYRIITESGASLVCSDTAPIPSRNKGLLTPDKLLGEEVAVRWDESGQNLARWEKVVKVGAVGTIKVQYITVGNKCFWAGEKKGAYILHHNLKNAGGGGCGGDDDGSWGGWDAESAKVPHNALPLDAPNADPGLADAQVVGVPQPIVDGLGLA